MSAFRKESQHSPFEDLSRQNAYFHMFGQIVFALAYAILAVLILVIRLTAGHTFLFELIELGLALLSSLLAFLAFAVYLPVGRRLDFRKKKILYRILSFLGRLVSFAIPVLILSSPSIGSEGWDFLSRSFGVIGLIYSAPMLLWNFYLLFFLRAEPSSFFSESREGENSPRPSFDESADVQKKSADRIDESKVIEVDAKDKK
jgi:hypothetical protein